MGLETKNAWVMCALVMPTTGWQTAFAAAVNPGLRLTQPMVILVLVDCGEETVWEFAGDGAVVTGVGNSSLVLMWSWHWHGGERKCDERQERYTVFTACMSLNVSD